MDHIINLHNSTSYDRSLASTLASIVQGTSPLVIIDGLDAIPIYIRITNRRPLQTIIRNLVPRVLERPSDHFRVKQQLRSSVVLVKATADSAVAWTLCVFLKRKR
ncbi:hypothetical protein L1049_002560 [Liquidambar formosana]|uniref:Uncharacterized protein n=1 Tax=Liquidambar formosana TaxID=63359 RepID=A0AAP0R8B0_LIQFO